MLSGTAKAQAGKNDAFMRLNHFVPLLSADTFTKGPTRASKREAPGSSTKKGRTQQLGMSKIGYFFWHFMLLALLLLSLNNAQNYALFAGKCQNAERLSHHDCHILHING